MEASNKSVSAASISSEPPTADKKVVYAVQISAILIIIIFCLINLTIPTLSGDNEKLWVGLLGSSIGYLLPNPSLKNRIKFV